MKTTITTTVAIVVSLVSVQFATAQRPVQPVFDVNAAAANAAPSQSTGRIATRGTNNGTSVIYEHASTFQEGFLRGWADLWRGVGDFNYNTSLALINREEARSRYMDNRMKWVNTYFGMRRANLEARSYERGPRKTATEIENFMKKPAAAQLSVREFNRALGRISWPIVLQDEAFAAERATLNELFANRTVNNSGDGSANHYEVSEVLAELKNKVNGHVRSLGSKNFTHAKRFLSSLELESATQVNIAGLAVN